MKTNRNKLRFEVFAVLMITLLITSCQRDNNYTGHAYFPDMYYSYAFETYGSSPNFSDSVRMLLPVEGTIPRHMMPYTYQRTFDDQKRAGDELVNPLATSETDLMRGKEQYDIYCALCHGENGNGKGHLYTSKVYPIQPTSLIGDYVQKKPDGEIYHVITMGSISGLMGPHGSLIKPIDRWKIVSYVKNGLKAK